MSAAPPPLGVKWTPVGKGPAFETVIGGAPDVVTRNEKLVPTSAVAELALVMVGDPGLPV
jgi:hypothetical protein